MPAEEILKRGSPVDADLPSEIGGLFKRCFGTATDDQRYCMHHQLFRCDFCENFVISFYVLAVTSHAGRDWSDRRRSMRCRIPLIAWMPIFLVACATTPSTPITSDQLVLNLADTPEARPDIFLTARLSGRLVSNGTCIVVRTRSAEVTPLWPVGTRLQSNGTTAEIILPDDRGRVKIGDHVVLSGGGGFSEYASRVGGNAGLCSSTHFSVATAK